MVVEGEGDEVCLPLFMIEKRWAVVRCFREEGRVGLIKGEEMIYYGRKGT